MHVLEELHRQEQPRELIVVCGNYADVRDAKLSRDLLERYRLRRHFDASRRDGIGKLRKRQPLAILAAAAYAQRGAGNGLARPRVRSDQRVYAEKWCVAYVVE